MGRACVRAYPRITYTKYRPNNDKPTIRRQFRRFPQCSSKQSTFDHPESIARSIGIARYLSTPLQCPLQLTQTPGAVNQEVLTKLCSRSTLVQNQVPLDNDNSLDLLNTLESSISQDYISGDESQLKLQKALLKLPDKQRLVFNMKYYDDMKYEEISEITGTSIGALKASYHLAVKKIEETLNSEEASF